MVFILMGLFQNSPLVVASDPLKIHAKSENMAKGFGKSVLPEDSILMRPRVCKNLSSWQAGEIAAEWFSEVSGTIFSLVVYRVI